MCQDSHRGDLPEHRFADAPIDRRQFVRLAGSVGAALALPGSAHADLGDAVSASDADVDDEYAFVVEHTPDDYPVPTLLEFDDESGIEELFDLGLDLELESALERVLGLDSPIDLELDLREDLTLAEPAVAYAPLTTTQVETVLDLPSLEEVSYTPGSNPFWRLGEYPFGVFPEPRRSLDFIDYEQMIDGMEHLATEHPDQLNFYALADADNPHEVSYGMSPGHENRLTDRHDPKDLHVAEVTNLPPGYDTFAEFRDSEAFADRQKVVFEASIHGLERAGPEACYRFVERVLTGREAEFERLLDDCVFIVLSVNPDGWVARSPQYDSGWQVGGDGTGLPRVPAAPLHERGNAEVFDTNRQYPTVGWIDPAHHAAEPDEERWAVDNPDDIVNTVPDAMGAVEHFRQYENLTHGADLHAMLWNSDFILGLINQIEYTQDEFHDLYEMNRVLEESLEEQLDEWETLADLQEQLTDDFNTDASGFPVLPETAYDFSTIWDTIGYTITGGLIGFMGASEERGGLDVTTMAFEMAYSHMVGGNVYNPELCELWVTGYVEAMRTMTEYALRDVESEIETRDGETTTVAYVETDALTRSSEELSFLQADPANEATTAALSTESLQREVESGDTGAVTIPVEEELHTLSVHAHAEQALADVVLRDPDGEVVRAYRPSETGGEAHHDFEPFVVREPAVGEWTLEVESLMADRLTQADVEVARLGADTEHPDPRDALGFEQEAYEVTPLAFFEDFADDNDLIETVALGPDDVADGALDPDAHDHLVVIHDDRGDDPHGYLSGLDDYVAGGGNLVLTDTGVHLLGELDAAAAVDAQEGHVTDDTFPVSHLEEKETDHPLLTDTREIQRMTWKLAPLGYPYADDAPMTLVDADAFADAGGTVAGTTDGWVSAGSIFTDDEDWQGIHVIGGLLPPANQTELHPFGLKNYVLAYFGFTMLVNALGCEQHRFVDGELVRAVGDVDQEPVLPDEPDEPDAFAVEGERGGDDDSLYTGGDTARTDLDVEVTAPEEETPPVIVRDTVPPDWDVETEYGDVEATTPAFGGGTHVYFGIEEPADAYESLTHFAETPDGLLDSSDYTLGPIAVTREVDTDRTLTDRDWDELEDTERDVAVLGI